MEPERKIEKWLRALAKKRRADAGDFKLHPATRRLLQDEVSRRAKTANAESDDDQPSLWQLFRQQWAFLIGFALIIFLAATMFLPNLVATKKRAQNAMAMNQLKEVGAAVQIAAEQDNGKLPASLDDLTNQLSRRADYPVNGEQIVYLGAGKDLDNLESNDVLAFSPANKDQHAILYADGRVEVADKKRFEELTNQKPVQLALRKVEAQTVNGFSAPATASPMLETPPSSLSAESPDEFQSAKLGARAAASGIISQGEVSQTNLWKFESSISSVANNPVAQNAYRNIAARRATPVLSAFQIEQNGSVVRVVDKDGSVYHGSLEMENTNAVALNEPVSKSLPEGQRQQQLQNYFFRVTGTNQTLQQKVVFSANVIALTNDSWSQMNSANFSGGGGGAGTPKTQSQPSLWSNSRIAGEAVVGGTNKIEINAEPSPQ